LRLPTGGGVCVWDYVVVGGGAAGSVVASRLSEDPAVRVLLLEAGLDWRSADAPAAIRRPELGPELLAASTLGRWQWAGVTARRTLAQQPRPYRQGAGLGGSSIINGMVVLRPPLSDFDGWAARGCTGWSGADVLPSFIRLEDDELFGHEPYHGRGGPVPVHRPAASEWGDLDLAFRDAAIAAGHPWNPDQNAPEPSGLGIYPANLRRGERVTANDSYLEAARERANLTIVGEALVDRVLFNGLDRATVAVRYRHHGGWRAAECGEVILCAGAIQSPAILLRSGIGPADDLRRLGIQVVQDAPIGRRLQDHPMLAVYLAGAGPRRPVLGRGYNLILRGSSLMNGGASSDFVVHPVDSQSPVSPTVAFFVMLYHCHARGVLRLASPNPQIAPIVDERMLTDKRDLVRMRAAVRRTVELAARPDLRRFGGQATLGMTGRTLEDVPNDATFDSLLLGEVTDGKHIAATCPMGAPGEDGVVVDPGGRVVGVSGLRVADLSIAPSAPRANTYLTAVMIGEHIAALLRGSV
jgi:choline dehydrogenase-like flavoprotein